MVRHIESEKEFNELVGKGRVLVDFFATWCGPCRMIAPNLEELGKDPSFEVEILKVDVDELEDLARAFQIYTIPTLMYFVDGKLVRRESTFMRKDQIVAFCK